ncbi:hypothetical protein ACFSUD_18995 [Sulfitobacter aestuarii]|uniref:Heme-copper oxidase subunit III family profile domain-containing protein n=1 Tax=Sulfitobacter aestuarii TaxID=2161676 RepID=A0ABW5U894_9RHOB
MSIILIFILAVLAICGHYLLRQGVMGKPWLETGIAPPAPPPRDAVPGAGIWLAVVLAIIGCVFALFGSAFVMRMELADWRFFTMPPLVWLNTLMLIGASLMLHNATHQPSAAQTWLTGALLATFGFMIGQLLVWFLLMDAGYRLTTGPAASFFYLLSGLHGLHILGGMAALALVAEPKDAGPQEKSRRLRYCAIYWDFLLLVWLGLLVLFLGWANRIIDICAAVLT